MSYTNGTSNRGGYEQIGPEAPLLNTGPSSDGSKGSRLVHFILGSITAVIVVSTFIGSFIFHKESSVALNVFFASCILLTCTSNISLMIWYRNQEVTSIVRFIIHFNSINIILLCICANLYLHGF
ncbi:transmembrane protein 243-like [Daphnia pulex]|uniref:transmembrane protein 243-like n=1 Tax=Daphnia pulex TaxID=6669 RepID=UPI001EDFCE9C|nr:transmembrane protein 243-like [Daphnia pulex]XP_046657607.1 transmembrane protein 243-like [Daphnia pulicaria]